MSTHLRATSILAFIFGVVLAAPLGICLAGSAPIVAQAQTNAPAEKTGSDAAAFQGTSETSIREKEEEDRRRISELTGLSKSWKTALDCLQSASTAVGQLQPPQTDLALKIDKATTNASLAKDITPTAQAFTALRTAAYPPSYCYSSSSLFRPVQNDPATAPFFEQWKQKMNTIFDANTFRILDEISSIQRAEKPFATDPNALQDLKDINVSGSRARWADLQKNVIAALIEMRALGEASSKSVATEISTKTAEIATADEKLEGLKVDINKLAIKIGLPAFCITVLLMLVIPIVSQNFSKRDSSGDQVKAIFASGLLVEIITVLLLTMTILILGLASRINSDVLGTLLGGISGYVLNRFRQSPKDSKLASGPTN